MKRLLQVVVAALLLVAVSYTIFTNVNDEHVSANTENVPLTSTTGIQQTLPTKGNYILNFWATYCPPCEREMPALASSYKTLQQQQIDLYAINVAEPTKLVNRYLTKFDLPFPVLLDRQGELKDSFEIVTLPTTIFLQNGKVIHTVKGEITEQQLLELSQKLY